MNEMYVEMLLIKSIKTLREMKYKTRIRMKNKIKWNDVDHIRRFNIFVNMYLYLDL